MSGEWLRAQMIPPMLRIVNEGQRLVETNYWQTENAKRGFMYLTTNAGCIRLLVPPSGEHLLSEMSRKVREVVLTRGRLEKVDDVTEVMFEDGSASPFCMHIDPKQVDRRWVPTDEGKQWRFAIYTQDRGKVADFARCYLRRAPTLPYVQPWTGRRP
jgi:hypothetical protein